MAEMQHRLTPTGQIGYVSGRQRTDEPPDGEHDWGLIVQFRLTPTEAATMSEGLPELLDGEKITYWTPVVCMRCEHEHAAVAGLDCPGDPDRYQRDGRPLWKVGHLWTPNPWRHREGTT